MPNLSHDPEFSPRTEHLKIDNRAYRELIYKAVEEVMRCLFINEAPSDLKMKKVQDQIRVFASNVEAWVRSIGVIKYKEGASGDVPKREWRRLVRIVRQSLLDHLLHVKEKVWRDARTRMVEQAGFAVFRVTCSSVHLHRLTPNKKFKHYG